MLQLADDGIDGDDDDGAVLLGRDIWAGWRVWSVSVQLARLWHDAESAGPPSQLRVHVYRPARLASFLLPSLRGRTVLETLSVRVGVLFLDSRPSTCVAFFWSCGWMACGGHDLRAQYRRRYCGFGAMLFRRRAGWGIKRLRVRCAGIPPGRS